MGGFSGKDRIEILGYEILHLISIGKKEDVEEMVRHFEKVDTLSYLLEKYKSEFFAIHEGCPYNLQDWDTILQEYSYLERHHDVVRKMGLLNADDGLLMLLSIILGIVSTRK